MEEREGIRVTTGERIAECVLTLDGDGCKGKYIYCREQIVRCRDCKHCELWHDKWMCHHFSMSSGAGWRVEANGFCAWGERRES